MGSAEMMHDYDKEVYLVDVEKAKKMEAENVVEGNELVFVAPIGRDRLHSPVAQYELGRYVSSYDYPSSCQSANSGGVRGFHYFGGARDDSWSNGVWIASLSGMGTKFSSCEAEVVKVLEISAFCWFRWPGHERHFQNILSKGVIMFNPDLEIYYPICDPEIHKPRNLPEPKFQFDINEPDFNIRFRSINIGQV